MNMTGLEEVVYEAIKRDCRYEYSSDIKMIYSAFKSLGNSTLATIIPHWSEPHRLHKM